MMELIKPGNPRGFHHQTELDKLMKHSDLLQWGKAVSVAEFKIRLLAKDPSADIAYLDNFLGPRGTVTHEPYLGCSFRKQTLELAT